jgi:hypothetical protein
MTTFRKRDTWFIVITTPLDLGSRSRNEGSRLRAKTDVHVRQSSTDGMLTKAAAAVATVALVQSPVRLVADVLILRRFRRVCAQLFDGPACAAAVAACVEEYQRELDLPPVHFVLDCASHDQVAGF